MSQESGVRSQESGVRSQESGVRSQERDSSLELLRIVTMLMIVAHHFWVHGGFKFPADSLTINKLFWTQFKLLGPIANDTFVMIAGFFLIKSRGIKVSKIFNLWLKAFFYSVVIFAVFVLSGLHKFSWVKMINFSLPFIINVQWWFASVYFVLYLIHPYLNILLNKFSREEYKKYLILIFILWCAIPTFTGKTFESNNLMRFIALYSLAGYFRLYGEEFPKKRFIFYGIILLFLYFAATVFFDFIGWKNPFYRTWELAMLSPFAILAALCLFLGFRALHIKSNKIINTIAAATFGVYLIHEHILLRPFLWRTIFKNATFQNSPYLILYSIGVVLLVFTVCTLIELTRSKIFKIISQCFFKLKKIIESSLDKMNSPQNIMESGIRNQESGIRNQESGIRNQESGIRNQESGIRGKVRDSSLELLRIVAMLMIIAQHFPHKFPDDSMFINKIWKQFILLGAPGDTIFVLISGYFLIKSSGINFQKIFRLWVKVFFYSVVFFAGFVLSGLHKFSWEEAISYTLPIVNAKWWFASTYFVLYLIHPYLNIVLHSLKREEYKKYLILIFILWSVIPTLTSKPLESNNLIRFIALYSLAGYFSLYGEEFAKKRFIFYGIIFLVINFLCSFVGWLGLKNPFFGAHLVNLQGMVSPFTVLGTLCLLLGFRGLHIKNNKFINTVASAMFGVYAIHTNKILNPFLWHKIFKTSTYLNSPYFIPYSIGVIFLVLAVCTVIELARSKIFKIISRGRLN